MRDKNKLLIDKIDIEGSRKTKKILNDLYSGKENIEDLTIQQKNDIYNLLIVEVVKKEIKLKNKKNQIFYNKIKYFESIDEILKIMSKRDREKFIEYLNQKGNVKKSMS